MLTKQLEVLIKSSLDTGKKLDDIRQILKIQGFLDSAITEIFAEYRQGSKGSYVAETQQSQVPKQENNIIQPNHNLANQTPPQSQQTPVSNIPTSVPKKETDSISNWENTVAQMPPVSQVEVKNTTQTQTLPGSQNQTPQPVQNPPVQEQNDTSYIDQIRNAESGGAIGSSINVGLGGNPELENAAYNAMQQESKKSPVGLIITLVFVLLIIVGFLYWFFFLTENSILDKEEDLLPSEPVEEQVDPGTIDPFTGQRFE